MVDSLPEGDERVCFYLGGLLYQTGGLIARGPSGGNYTYVMVGDQATPAYCCRL